MKNKTFEVYRKLRENEIRKVRLAGLFTLGGQFAGMIALGIINPTLLITMVTIVLSNILIGELRRRRYYRPSFREIISDMFEKLQELFEEPPSRTFLKLDRVGWAMLALFSTLVGYTAGLSFIGSLALLPLYACYTEMIHLCMPILSRWYVNIFHGFSKVSIKEHLHLQTMLNNDPIWRHSVVWNVQILPIPETQMQPSHISTLIKMGAKVNDFPHYAAFEKLKYLYAIIRQTESPGGILDVFAERAEYFFHQNFIYPPKQEIFIGAYQIMDRITEKEDNRHQARM